MEHPEKCHLDILNPKHFVQIFLQCHDLKEENFKDRYGDVFDIVLSIGHVH